MKRSITNLRGSQIGQNKTGRYGRSINVTEKYLDVNSKCPQKKKNVIEVTETDSQYDTFERCLKYMNDMSMNF